MAFDRSDFLRGLRSGIPVFIGYFTASIAFGLLAVTAGLRVFPEAPMAGLLSLCVAAVSAMLFRRSLILPVLSSIAAACILLSL